MAIGLMILAAAGGVALTGVAASKGARAAIEAAGGSVADKPAG